MHLPQLLLVLVHHLWLLLLLLLPPPPPLLLLMLPPLLVLGHICVSVYHKPAQRTWMYNTRTLKMSEARAR
jgi:hypothetical protein